MLRAKYLFQSSLQKIHISWCHCALISPKNLEPLVKCGPRLHLCCGALPSSWRLQALDVHIAEAVGRASSKATGVHGETYRGTMDILHFFHDDWTQSHGGGRWTDEFPDFNWVISVFQAVHFQGCSGVTYPLKTSALLESMIFRLKPVWWEMLNLIPWRVDILELAPPGLFHPNLNLHLLEG